MISQPAVHTVKAVAIHVGVNRRTLERQWAQVCRVDRQFQDCLRLVSLLRFTGARGTQQQRAYEIRKGLKALRYAALELAGDSLADVIRQPVALIETLKVWTFDVAY
jgi:hypothetical protein